MSERRFRPVELSPLHRLIDARNRHACAFTAGVASCLQWECANHTTKTSVYPQEGQFVFLMEDRPLTMQGNILTKEAIKNLSGRCHPLAIGSQKARKVAHSTSMGETNCGLSVVSNAQMVAMRLTEMHVTLRGSVSQRIAILIDIPEVACWSDPRRRRRMAAV